MTATLLGEMREGRSGGLRKSGKQLILEEQYQFRVVTNDKTTDDKEVLLATGIPRPGVTLSDYGNSICTDTTATRDATNPLYWTVTATFSSDVQEDTSGASESQTGNPTSWVPIAEINFETFQFYDVKDVNGVPFTNSAGLQFGTGVPLTRTLTRYDFEQFEAASTTLDEITERNETVNSGTFLRKPAKTLKLSVQKATLGFYYGFRVWRVAYSIVYKPDNWRMKMLDIGPFYLSGGRKVPFKTDDPPERPYQGFLTPTGAESTTSTVKEFDQYDDINFALFLRVVD
jgi:hypothetical protein